jgi:hypothetical protein
MGRYRAESVRPAAGTVLLLRYLHTAADAAVRIIALHGSVDQFILSQKQAGVLRPANAFAEEKAGLRPERAYSSLPEPPP